MNGGRPDSYRVCFFAAFSLHFVKWKYFGVMAERDDLGGRRVFRIKGNHTLGKHKDVKAHTPARVSPAVENLKRALNFLNTLLLSLPWKGK